MGSSSHPRNRGDATVSAPVSLTEFECDDYVAFFVDRVVDRGYTGRSDQDQVEALIREFDSYANTSGIQPNPLFRALGRRGIKSKLVDLDKSDSRYLDKKATGIVRPRMRIYFLPTEVPELQGEHVSDISDAASATSHCWMPPSPV
ncbi:MAG: hypothetical protein AAGD43_28080 [Pseudomonadota bacterium]